MVHPDVFSKQVVSPNVQGVVVSPNVQGVVKPIDVGNDFKNTQEFESRDQMLQWIRMETYKLGFGVVIRRSYNGSNRKCAFVTMICERSEKYRTPLRIFKRDDTGIRKYDCPFKYLTSKTLKGDKIEMQQLLKLLDDNNYLPKYRTCDDGVNVRDIFWTHPDSIKLFNTFPTVLILDSTYKTNKYKLPLLEMVDVTSTEKTYLVGFSFLVCEKEDSFTWALEVSHNKEYEKSGKPAVETKQIEFEDGKMVKAGVVKEKIVCAWTDNVRHLKNTITNRVESVYATLKNWLGNSKGDLCRDWDSGNPMIQTQHNEIQTTFGRSITILEQLFKDNILYSRLVGYISRASSDSVECGCIIVKTYGLPCACVIAKNVKLGHPIRMDEVCTHWKRLRFDGDGCMDDGKSNISILTE
ncbi:uncharacterized protein LOC127093944 [Lathyrus oleraceus]|uniref:uncharacterized protein LOC127093944 n=1 Tax=Pisum sativum TaxID=3888 RepID=UPI0021D16FAF|nr:uncharacterized protein LOC127093944 [Pisum sativum]